MNNKNVHSDKSTISRNQQNPASGLISANPLFATSSLFSRVKGGRTKTTGMLLLSTIFLLLFFTACADNDDVTTTKKSKDNPQGASSLEGTVWVHHPDTDPDSQNWFNLHHSPNTKGYDISYPVEIYFLANGIISEPTADVLPMGKQHYYYSYAEPYVTITMCLGGPCENNCSEFSVAELQKKWDLCPLKIDDYKCDPLKCKNNSAGNDLNLTKCVNNYRFLGKVDGDVMHLQAISILNTGEIDIHRDVYLVKAK